MTSLAHLQAGFGSMGNGVSAGRFGLRTRGAGADDSNDLVCDDSSDTGFSDEQFETVEKLSELLLASWKRKKN